MANEKRLIDANALIRNYEAHRNLYLDAWGSFSQMPTIDKVSVDTIDTCISDVINAPTVDAVEVVHGRWVDEYGGKYANPRYRCSICKEKALYKFERDLLGNHKEVQALTPNCPYCMAKLDGGVGNDI